MKTYEIIVPCHFGLEAVLKKEIDDLGYDICKVEDGRVTFIGDMEAICRANVFLRSAERVLLKVGSFYAYSFNELFEETRSLEWAQFIPKDGRCWVTKASSVKSKLFSTSDIQSIVKKALVEKLKSEYEVDIIPETGAAYPLRVFALKDEFTIAIDTTGESLHKRGYRQSTTKAPISETLASALLMLTPWKYDRILVDPFCGSGTFAIEAAMMAANMAPGMNRSFISENWKNLIPRKLWYDTMDEANDLVDLSVKTDIQGYDIDPSAVSMARENAERAGVSELIHLQQRPVDKLSHSGKYGFIVTNPPYGERLEDKADLPAIYRALGERYRQLDSWSMYVITSYENAQKDLGRQADKNRKIYNGMLKTYYYQYLGPKPPKRKNPFAESEKA